jgi:hypothetical protein
MMASSFSLPLRHQHVTDSSGSSSSVHKAPFGTCVDHGVLLYIFYLCSFLRCYPRTKNLLFLPFFFYLNMQVRNRSSVALGSFLVAFLAATTTSAFVVPQSSSCSSSRRTTTFKLSASEGYIKTVSKPGTGKQVNLGDIATVKYTCYLPDDAKGAPFARSDKQKMVRRRR